MNDDSTDLRLESAQEQLRAALARLSALRRQALYGTYDSDEFAKAVAAYRAAEAAVASARHTRGEQLRGASVTLGSRVATTTEDAGPLPLTPTPRLLFTRWLVQTGRLSDWPA